MAAWARSRNRRVLHGVLARVVSAWVVVALFAVALPGLPALAKATATPWPAALPAAKQLPSIALVAGLVLAAAIGVAGVVRYLRRRTEPLALARSLDAEHATSDLLATALSVELHAPLTGALHPASLSLAVLGQARQVAGSIGSPVPRYRLSLGFALPMLLAAALAAALVWLPRTLARSSASNVAPADELVRPEDPKLSREDVDKLDKLDKKLGELESQKGLSEEARKKLAAARRELAAARKSPGRSAGHLSAAQRALQELAEEAREQGGLFDPPSLEKEALDTITQQLVEAIERGDASTAAAMESELSRRVKSGSQSSTKDIGRSLDEALKEAKPSKHGGADPKDLADWRKLAEEARDHFNKGEASAARKKLEDLVDKMGQKSQRSLEQSLSDLKGIRSKQLATLNEQRGAPDPSNAQPGAGKPGDPSAGKPGDKSGKGDKSGPGDKGAPGDKGPPGGNTPGSKGAPGDKSAQKGLADKGGSGDGDQGGKDGGSGPEDGDGAGGPGGGGGTSNKVGTANPFGKRLGSERVRVARRGPLPGAVGAVSKFLQGGDDGGEYGDLHQEYSAIAEGMMRSEAIPLTRRDYIRHYFQAVRPQ